jgi:hypothetical protein
MSITDQANKLLSQGHHDQHRLCAMQRNVTVVANVAGNPFWMATVADANNQHFNGIGKTPTGAVELALCYIAISRQGGG